MSHIRCVVNGQYVWSTNQPQTAVSRPSAYASHPVAVIGSMVPVLGQGAVYGNRHRVNPPVRALSIHPENALCNVPLHHKGRNFDKETGDRCARTLGHADTHSSRRTMDNEAIRRRSPRVWA